MPLRLRHLLLFAAAVMAGCASAERPVAPMVNPLSKATAPDEDPKSMLALDAITPVPHLSPPASQPASRPPVAALELFGRGRDLMLKGQPAAAVALLRQAILLDPYRFDLRYELGQAYLATGGADENAIDAFVKAAAIDPDHLQLQVQLGRLYLDRNDVDDAQPHLRLALQTTEYTEDDGEAAVADYLLARALKQQGYDRAALDQYLVVLHRLENPTNALRENAELAYLLERPETLYVQIGELLEKHGEYDQAVKAFTPAADHEPEDFDLHARIARDLARLGRKDEALEKAVDLIVQDRATPASLKVLQDVCGILNIHKGEVAELRKLNRRRPTDQAVLFALADTLIADGQPDQAVALLESAWQKTNNDVRIARRLFALYRQTGSIASAAQLLIGTLARNPDLLHNLDPMWTELFQVSRADRLTLSTALAMQVPPPEQAAKLLLIALEAENEERPAVARNAMQHAADCRPIFPPAEREWIAFTWARPELSADQKVQKCDELVSAVHAAGQPALAAELRGRSLLAQSKLTEAAAAFSSAKALGGDSADLLLAAIESRRKTGHDATFEQDLWAMTSRFPLYQDAYVTLFEYYANADTASLDQATKVLVTLLLNDPQNVIARVSQARLDSRLGQVREAEQELLRLFDEDPDDSDVYLGLRLYYVEIGRIDKLIAKLEEARVAHPKDTEIVARLVSLYAGQKRNAEAIRLLDATRTAVAADADLLYSLASLYAGLGQRQTADAVLSQVLDIDPAHVGACNDLGFEWADEGKDLARAEAMIRVAVAAEPDNEAFLDSLGWVLYKRGQFAEAKEQLELAIGPVAFPDPAVLDHLGDTFYRLTRLDDAKQTWQRSLAGLGDHAADRPDLSQLRLRLLQKIKAVESGKPVSLQS